MNWLRDWFKKHPAPVTHVMVPQEEVIEFAGSTQPASIVFTYPPSQAREMPASLPSAQDLDITVEEELVRERIAKVEVKPNRKRVKTKKAKR